MHTISGAQDHPILVMTTPLHQRAVRPRLQTCPLVFQWNGTGLHATSMLNVIGNMDEREPNTWVDPKMGGRRITAHGFRSTFTDWAAETTSYDFKVYDKALSHAESSQTVAAYLRGDMLAKRRPLMNEWATFCCDR